MPLVCKDLPCVDYSLVCSGTFGFGYGVLFGNNHSFISCENHNKMMKFSLALDNVISEIDMNS